MYAIIYWLNNDHIYPLLTKDCQLKLFETFKEAEKFVNKIESDTSGINKDEDNAIFFDTPGIDDEVECRIITIEKITE
jgi:hypothetical protein